MTAVPGPSVSAHQLCHGMFLVAPVEACGQTVTFTLWALALNVVEPVAGKGGWVGVEHVCSDPSTLTSVMLCRDFSICTQGRHSPLCFPQSVFVARGCIEIGDLSLTL